MFNRRRRSRQSASYTGVNQQRGTEKKPNAGALAAASVIGEALKQNGNNPVGMKLPPHQTSRRLSRSSSLLSLNTNLSRRNSIQTISGTNQKAFKGRKLSNSSSMYNMSLRDRRSISDFSEYSSQFSRNRTKQQDEPTYYKKVKKWVPSKRGLVSVEVMVPIYEQQKKASQNLSPKTDRTYSLAVGSYGHTQQANRTPTRSRPNSMLASPHVKKIEMTEFDFEPSIPESLEEDRENIVANVKAARESAKAKLGDSPLKRNVISTTTEDQGMQESSAEYQPKSTEGSTETQKVTEKDEAGSFDSHEKQPSIAHSDITVIKTASNDSLARGKELEIVNSYTAPVGHENDGSTKESNEDTLNMDESTLLNNADKKKGDLESNSLDLAADLGEDNFKEKPSGNGTMIQSTAKKIELNSQKTNIDIKSDEKPDEISNKKSNKKFEEKPQEKPQEKPREKPQIPREKLRKKPAESSIKPVSMAQQMRKTLGITNSASNREAHGELKSPSSVKRHSVLKNPEDGQESSSYNAKGITGPYLSITTAENTRRNAMGATPSPARVNSLYNTPVRSQQNSAKLSGSPVMLTLRSPKPQKSSARKHLVSSKSLKIVTDINSAMRSEPSAHLSAAKMAVEQYYGDEVLHKRKPASKRMPKSLAQVRADELLKKAKSRPPVQLENAFNPNTENYNELKRASSFEGRHHNKKGVTVQKRFTLRDMSDEDVGATDGQFVSSSHFKSRIPDSDDDDDDFDEMPAYSSKPKSHQPPQQPKLMMSQIAVPPKKHHKHFKLFGHHHHHHDSNQNSMIQDDYARHEPKKKKRFGKLKKFFSTRG